jgi:hypothetical protein
MISLRLNLFLSTRNLILFLFLILIALVVTVSLCVFFDLYFNFWGLCFIDQSIETI